MALLVVSTEVPDTYAALLDRLRDFPAFAICFLFLLQVWYAHFKFFRRFGLQDLPTVVLNGALLFVVLFYVFPVKFLFTFLVDLLLGLASPQELDARMRAARTAT